MTDLVKLNPGDQIDKWIIVDKLGEGEQLICGGGDFGAVYKVAKDDKYYALKTENADESIKVLKIEVYFMRLANKRKSRHFCVCEDAGAFASLLYLVMTMVGPSLQDHRKALPGQKFSIGCALSVGIQCLEAIEDLHEIGFLHRDLKPSNFASGREDMKETRVIYLLDFGMCRQYQDEKGQIRKPRISPGFRGTIRYAPLSSHIKREYSRKDDIESWLYQQIEITRGALPWRSIESRDKVAMFKERCRFDVGLRELMGGCPCEYIEILRYVDNLRYYDQPDYKKIYTALRRSITALGAREYPYDWEVKSVKQTPSNRSCKKQQSG
ncbi:Tau-tubulin kinase 1 [Aphelenchoides bicaudatus]|nr:Tau-tubulin kinase 1 [Aphelenchoides bicaudatus]